MEKISDPYGSMWIWGIKSPTWGVQVHALLLNKMGLTKFVRPRDGR